MSASSDRVLGSFVIGAILGSGRQSGVARRVKRPRIQRQFSVKSRYGVKVHLNRVCCLAAHWLAKIAGGAAMFRGR